MKNFLPANTVYTAENPDGGYLLYHGRLSEEKGLMTLLRAVAGLQDVRLLIAGSGAMQEDMEQFIADHQMEERVQMLGFQRGDALRRLVAEAKCVVLPSEWYENGPYAVMEAMAQGKPVIASRIGGLPEIVRDGVTGYLCTPFNSDSLSACIRKVWALSPVEYHQMQLQAVEHARRWFGWEAYREQLLSLYDQLIAKDQTAFR